jgi:TRAP transporter TAXI family solute receptor
MKRALVVIMALALVVTASTAGAAKTERLSIATGGTGGVYYPMGGAMAAVISKYIPSTEATAEVTAASVDNCLLIGQKKADLAFSMADTAWDAYSGVGKPFPRKLPLRTVLVLYPNNLHVVTLEGKGVEKVADLKGKRVSTGSPGSGTEVMGLRLLEAAGLNPDKDVKRDKLGVSESAGALKDGKVDAFLWGGGIPTAAVLDLAATPGVRMKLVPHGDLVAKMREKYGPIYVTGVIPAHSYPGQTKEVQIAVVWNVLVCNASLPENLVYMITKVFLEHRNELVAVHKDASYITLQNQAAGASPIPFHAGALRYFKEQGLKVK